MQEHEARGEKRAFQRRTVGDHLAVRFRSEMLEFEARAELIGEVLDVSDGGLFIRSEYLELPGTPVMLTVWLPTDKHPRMLKGVVAWVAEGPPKGPGMGIKLVQSWAA